MGAPINPPVTGGDSPLGRHPLFLLSKPLNQNQAEVRFPRAHASKQARSGLYRYPTRRWPAACRVHLRPQCPPPGAGGGAQGLPSPARGLPARPTRSGTEADGEAFLEKFKGSSCRHPANQARQQTPTSGRTRSRRDGQSPPLRSRARRPRRERGSRHPARAGPEAEQCPGAGWGPGRAARPGVPKPSWVPDRDPGGSLGSTAARGAEKQDACAPRGRSTCSLPTRVARRAPTFAGSPGRARRSLGGGGRRRHHLRRAAAAPGLAPEARGALDPEPAAPPAAATSKRGGGAGAPRAAAAAAAGAAAHDSVTRGIRQSVTWTPGPCRRRSSGTNRSLRAPRLAGSQPMGRARASM